MNTELGTPLFGYVVIPLVRIIIICIILTAFFPTLSSLTVMSQAPVIGLVHALLLDSFFQNFLFGVNVAQSLQYWNNCKDDPRPRRIFVATVVSLSV